MLIAAAVVILLAAVVLMILRRRWIIVTVYGLSMEPTLVQGDRVLVRRTPGEAVRKGDIVLVGVRLLDSGDDDTEKGNGIKRVVAAPGDPAPDVFAGCPAQIEPGETAPKGYVLLLSDNEKSKSDSREYGYFSLEDVRGVMARKLSQSGGRGNAADHESPAQQVR